MFNHSDHIIGNEIGDSPFNRFCHFCGGDFIAKTIEDFWPITDDDILAIHSQTSEIYKEECGLEDCYLNLTLDTADFTTVLHYCTVCGWWRVLKRVRICAEQWQIWQMFFGVTGSLKNLDLININAPLDEVRDFIARNYEKRWYINPRLFEKLVGSVFQSLGYETIVTGYTHDGGVDIILTDTNNKKIGVQVKRSKNKITVEQIRSFVGSLVLKDIPAGIFITTSSFTSEALEIREQSKTRQISLDLVNSTMFYDALKIAQMSDRISSNMPFKPTPDLIPKIGYYDWEVPMNSL